MSNSIADKVLETEVGLNSHFSRDVAALFSCYSELYAQKKELLGDFPINDAETGMLNQQIHQSYHNDRYKLWVIGFVDGFKRRPKQDFTDSKTIRFLRGKVDDNYWAAILENLLTTYHRAYDSGERTRENYDISKDDFIVLMALHTIVSSTSASFREDFLKLKQT